MKIILDIQPTTTSLEISDDGVGLPMQVESSAGMGLKLLRYLANLLRARISYSAGFNPRHSPDFHD
jgi:two-component sensor histidine kinase